MHDTIIKALQWRYAVKEFDPTKKVSDKDFQTIIEAGRLAPSANGHEPWKFVIVQNPGLRAKLREVSYGQPKVTDASHLIVLTRRTDARQNSSQELVARSAAAFGKDPSELADFKAYLDGGLANRSDADNDASFTNQVYIPLGIMIETAALLGVDSGPMEGFANDKVDAVLGLADHHLTSCAMLALGYRNNSDAYASRPKVRRSLDDVTLYLR